MANRSGQSLPSSSAYFRSPEQSQSNADVHPQTDPQRDTQYEAVLSKIKNDIGIIRSRLRERTTTAYVASEAIEKLRQLEDKLRSATKGNRNSFKNKRFLRDLSKSILRLMAKVKEESGADPVVAARGEAQIMAQFELDCKLAFQDISDGSRSIREASGSTLDLRGQTSTYHAGDDFQYIPSAPAIPTILGGQSRHQQSIHKLTNKSTTSLTQGYYTSSRQGGRPKYATQSAQSSSSYAYPQVNNPVVPHTRDDVNSCPDTPKHSFQPEAGRQDRDPRYAPQNYDGSSYETTSYASRRGCWEREPPNAVMQPQGRHSTDAWLSYASYQSTPEPLTTIEFEDRSVMESQDLHAAAISEDFNEVPP